MSGAAHKPGGGELSMREQIIVGAPFIDLGIRDSPRSGNFPHACTVVSYQQGSHRLLRRGKGSGQVPMVNFAPNGTALRSDWHRMPINPARATIRTK